MTTRRHKIITEDLDSILANPLPWEMFSGATVVVTGASGLLPGYIVETLLRLNEMNQLSAPARVVAISRSKEKLLQRFSTYHGRDDLVVRNGDVCEPCCWGGRIDYLIHGASPASPTAMAEDLLGTFTANVYGTRQLLEAAREKRARDFLFLSSGAVYGNVPDGVKLIDETQAAGVNPFSVRAAYEEGKRAGETLCYLYGECYGMSVKSARIFHTFGPGMRPDDGRAFADFVTAAVEGRPIRLHSDGSAIRYFSYISDTIAGLFTILLRGMPGTAYNVGSETECCSIREFAEMVVSLLPEKDIHIEFCNASSLLKAATSSMPPTPFSTHRLRSLGWKDAVSIRDGLRRTILSYFP